MFKESDKNPQFDAFLSPAALLQGSSLNHYLKKDSRHNIFREHIVMRVNEDIFKDLYCSDNGSPNASMRVLAGMMILKKGQGWSNEQLFEQCQYNLLVRSALGKTMWICSSGACSTLPEVGSSSSMSAANR